MCDPRQRDWPALVRRFLAENEMDCDIDEGRPVLDVVQFAAFTAWVLGEGCARPEEVAALRRQVGRVYS